MISGRYIKNRNFNLSSISQLGFEYEGYVFEGWKTDLCGDSILTDEQIVKFNSNDVYLSAQWKKNSKNLIMKTINGNDYSFDPSSPDINGKLQYCSSTFPYNPTTPYSNITELQNKDNLVEVNDTKGDISSIGDEAFYNCENLSSINCQNVESIGDGAFQYCYYLSSINCLSVTSIGDRSFKHCSELTSINIQNVSSIGIDAFIRCSNLTSINIPNVTSIGDGAFYGCSKLTSINIPNVESIGDQTFEECSILSIIDFSERTLTTIPTLGGIDAFLGLPSDYQIKVPSSLYDDWIKADNWTSIKSHIVAV